MLDPLTGRFDREIVRVEVFMRRRLHSVYFSVLFIASFPYIGLVNAQESVSSESTERIVRLVDGSFYRGELLEYVPKSHVVIRLSGGREMRIAWPQVRAVDAIHLPPKAAAKVAPPALALPAPPAVSVESSTNPERGPTEAVRQPVADRSIYTAHVDQAQAAYARGLYSEAVEHFKAAYRSHPDSGLRYQLARAYHQSGAYSSAAAEYESFLREAEDLSAGKRVKVEDYLARAHAAASSVAALPEPLRVRASSEATFVSLESTRPDARLQQQVLHWEDNSGWGPAARTEPQLEEVNVWRTVCKQPCQKLVSSAGIYRIAGSNTVSSEPFRLPAETRDARVTVGRGSLGMRAGAIVMLSLGASLAIAGAGTGFATLQDDAPRCSATGLLYPCQTTAEASAAARDSAAERVMLRDATIGLVLSGAALVLGSIPLFVFSKTKVDIH